ncbi:hypothetical protein NSPZN2_10593 [Nitrospira defluvii]|uniref:Uncharacterized protein n=1 Tax=Nitrospira defluvii TaxID=330214 RepID=A0ABN7KKP8_9BACT|nr:hypothetical protein NSPZN2_10593 [Nitrospira defluvii]
MGQHPAQAAFVSFIEGFVAALAPLHDAHEPGGQGAVRLLLRLQETITECRGDRPGDEERGEECDRDRERQRNEQESCDTDDKKHRQKDDDGGDRGGEDRHGDLARGVDDGVPAVPVDVQMALNVFELDDRVVYQPPDTQREPAHREHVEGLIGEIQHDERHENRERDGDGDDQRAGEISQEQENDRRREQRSVQRLLNEVLDRLPDVNRLIEGDPQLHAGRDADHFRNRFAQRIDHFHRVGDRLLVDAEIHRPFAVRADDVGLNVRGVGQDTDIPHTHGIAARVDLDDDVVDRFHGFELGVGEHVVVEVPGLDVARRQDQVGGLHRLDDVEDRQASRLEQCRVQIDVDLPDLPALYRGGRDVGDLFDLRGNGVVGQVVECPFVKVAAGCSHERDGNIGDVELDDKGLENAGWQAVQDLGDALHHLHLAYVDVRAPIEPDLHRPDALLGKGLHMFDVGGGTDGFLNGVHDALFDIERRRALVNDPDECDRNLNVGKEIDRQSFQRRGPQDHHGEGQHQDADAIAEREECQPHIGDVNGETLEVKRREYAVNAGDSCIS